MSDAPKRPLAEAEEIAEWFRQLFSGTYTRWDIAGSIRRQRPEVGDVEHVVIPNYLPNHVANAASNLVWLRAEELSKNTDTLFPKPDAPLDWHTYSDGHNRKGRVYRGYDFDGMLNEIFCCTLGNWGPTLAIRTGPAEFSEMLVTKMKAGKRFCQSDGYVTYASGENKGTKIECYSEEVYFNYCNVDYLPPEKRLK